MIKYPTRFLPLLTLTILSFALLSCAMPAIAHAGARSLLANHRPTASAASGSTKKVVIPLVCNPDENPAVTAMYVHVNGQLALQLNDGSDVNDIVGALINGVVDQPLSSVQVDFMGPAEPPNSGPYPEGPNIFILGNDAYGNGVLAIASSVYPSTAKTAKDGFTRKVFYASAFQTVATTQPEGNLYPVAKMIAMDIETSGLPAPVYMKNIVVNGQTAAYDTKPSDTVGCLLIPSPF